MQTPDTTLERGDSIGRRDVPRSALNTVWPLVALTLLALMLLRACVPATLTHVPFDSKAAAVATNQTALAALRALRFNAPLPEVLAALNLTVIDFATASTDLPAEARDVLQQAAIVLDALPQGTRLTITGHTDNVGDPRSNRALSLRRAETVRAFLVENGAPPAMLATAGAGDTQPIASNNTEVGRARNRRIEFSAAP